LILPLCLRFTHDGTQTCSERGCTIFCGPFYNSSGGLSHSQAFSPPARASEMRFGYEVTLDKGWLAFSNASLERRQVAYTISRKTYFLGGAAIATRISGDPEGANDLFYIHTDHLGSTSLMSDAAGQKVETSVGRYLPYGRWRTEPTANLTDRAIHLHSGPLQRGGSREVELWPNPANYQSGGAAHTSATIRPCPPQNPPRN
jgi:hypothetical protein